MRFAGVIALVCFWSHYPSYPFIDASRESAILQTEVCITGVYMEAESGHCTCISYSRS